MMFLVKTVGRVATSLFCKYSLMFFFCFQVSAYAQSVHFPASCQTERDRLISEWTRAEQLRWSVAQNADLREYPAQYRQVTLEDLQSEAQDSREIDLLMRGPACLSRALTDVDRRLLGLYIQNGYASSSQAGFTQTDLQVLLNQIRVLCVQPFSSRDVDSQTGRELQRRSSLEFNELPDFDRFSQRELRELQNHPNDYFLDVFDEASRHLLTHEEFNRCETFRSWTQCSPNDRRIQRMFYAAQRIKSLYSDTVIHLEDRLRREVGDRLFTESRGTFFQQRTTAGVHQSQLSSMRMGSSLASFFNRINVLPPSQEEPVSVSRAPTVREFEPPKDIWNWLDSLLPNQGHILAVVWNHLLIPDASVGAFFGPAPGFFLVASSDHQSHQREDSEFSEYLFDRLLDLPRVTFNSTFRVSDLHGGDDPFESALANFFARLQPQEADQKIEKRVSLDFLFRLSFLQDPRVQDFFTLTLEEARRFPWSISDQEQHRDFPEIFNDSSEHRELFRRHRDSLEKLGQAVVRSYEIIQQVFDSHWVHAYRYLWALQYFYSLTDFNRGTYGYESSVQLISEFRRFLTYYYNYKKETADLPSTRAQQLRVYFCLDARGDRNRPRQLCETWNLQDLADGHGRQTRQQLMMLWSRSGGHRYHLTQSEYVQENQSLPCRGYTGRPL